MGKKFNENLTMSEDLNDYFSKMFKWISLTKIIIFRIEINQYRIFIEKKSVIPYILILKFYQLKV